MSSVSFNLPIVRSKSNAGLTSIEIIAGEICKELAVHREKDKCGSYRRHRIGI